ncbi:MAG: hypothetical protein H0T46_28590 [Deltaproteobacteria bacterium]|nr:hypothetical protein [Deltaproteobacteria bacterium]
MGEIRFGDTRANVTSATLDLYHLYSKRPGWDLEVELDGPIPQLTITGTGARPALPGPSPMEVAYLDHPAIVMFDGARGSLALVESKLSLVEVGQGRVRITGTLATTWRASDATTRPYAIELDLDAALVT